MSQTLTLTGNAIFWHPGARLGVLDGGASAVPVMVRLHRGDVAPSCEGLRGDGVLELLGEESVTGGTALAFRRVEGLGLHHLVQEGALPPGKAAVAIVARVARILQQVGDARVSHAGPCPEDVLIGVDGQVWLCGFEGGLVDSERRAPGGDRGEAGLVFRLGLLLAQLLSGADPYSASTEQAHEALLRRVLIRAMARPGPLFPDRLGDWTRAMLAWSPVERPALSAVVEGLAEVEQAMAGEGLLLWAVEQVPRHREALLMAAHATMDGVLHDETQDGLEPLPTEIGELVPGRTTVERQLPDFGPSDDPTVDSSMGLLPARKVKEPGNIPVAVGPPPEAVGPEPRLPKGFLGSEETQQLTPPPAQVNAGPEDRMRWLVLWTVVVGGVLLGLAVVLVALLMMPVS